MTKKTRKADENVQQLAKIRLTSITEQGIKENMKMNLAEKIRDFSKEFKLNEEKYIKNYSELVGESTEHLDFESGNARKSNNSHHKANDFLQVQDPDLDVLRKRDEEISTLVNSISELATIYKDMQTLVSHQGTILDRIDYNIEASLVHVKDGHKHLVKTDKMMQGNCYRNCTLTLIVAIFVMAVLLVLKIT